MTETERSLARVDASDLLRLAALAAEAETALFARHPSGAGRYAGRLLCRALCQGAALLYLDGRTGVKDFDVWSFYAALADGPFPYRWRGTADFGPSKFGRWPSDPPIWTDGSPWRFLAAALRRGSLWAATREAGIALPGVPMVRVPRSPVRTGRAGGTICRRFRLGFLLSCASGGPR
jgi:hypothetical protein